MPRPVLTATIAEPPVVVPGPVVIEPGQPTAVPHDPRRSGARAPRSSPAREVRRRPGVPGRLVRRHRSAPPRRTRFLGIDLDPAFDWAEVVLVTAEDIPART